MSHEKTISDLAYHLWRARGCPNGSSEVDWAEAERQVRGMLSGSTGRALDAPLPVTERAAPDRVVGAPAPDSTSLKSAATADTPGIRAKKKAKR